MVRDVETLEPVVPAETLETGVPRVDLWYYLYDRDHDETRIARQAELLAPDERERRDRLRFGRDRRMFVATRALVRTVLSQYHAVDPSDWEFEIDDRGRPHLTATSPRSGLTFNLTNTRGLVACGVASGDRGVGIDAERLDRRVEITNLAERYFAPFEVREFHRQDPDAQLRRFFTYWTLKESYIKARGLGLAIPLGSFWFHLEGSDPRIELASEEDDDPRRWRFALLDLETFYLAAVAIDSGGIDFDLRASHFVP